jgi:hypothetical protein
MDDLSQFSNKTPNRDIQIKPKAAKVEPTPAAAPAVEPSAPVENAQLNAQIAEYLQQKKKDRAIGEQWKWAAAIVFSLFLFGPTIASMIGPSPEMQRFEQAAKNAEILNKQAACTRNEPGACEELRRLKGWE